MSPRPWCGRPAVRVAVVLVAQICEAAPHARCAQSSPAGQRHSLNSARPDCQRLRAHRTRACPALDRCHPQPQLLPVPIEFPESLAHCLHPINKRPAPTQPGTSLPQLTLFRFLLLSRLICLVGPTTARLQLSQLSWGASPALLPPKLCHSILPSRGSTWVRYQSFLDAHPPDPRLQISHTQTIHLPPLPWSRFIFPRSHQSLLEYTSPHLAGPCRRFVLYPRRSP